ncbi:MAG: ABC transporter permease [Acidimicrobiales bacterium]
MPPRRRLGAAATIGLALVGLFVAVALSAPVLAPYDPAARPGPPNAPPSGAHLLGTDDVGHDIWSHLILGTRASVVIGLASAALATALGAVLGAAAGYSRGWVDALVSRSVDVSLALPTLPLLVVLAAFLGRSLFLQILVIAALAWARPARIIRAQVMGALTRGHVQAAEVMGAQAGWILTRHVSYYTVPLLIPLFVRVAMIAVVLEASLAFLGLGDPSRISWGTMLFWANSRGAFLGEQWLWWVLPPGVAIATLVVAFALVGVAIEDRVNPSLDASRVPVAARA